MSSTDERADDDAVDSCEETGLRSVDREAGGGRDGLLQVQAPQDSLEQLHAVIRPYLNKGSVSNIATFSVMLMGMALKEATRTEVSCPEAPRSVAQEAARFVLAAGLFGFAGGITNWLAIKMLFDRVCNLPGSGVIPRRFKEIRQALSLRPTRRRVGAGAAHDEPRCSATECR